MEVRDVDEIQHILIPKLSYFDIWLRTHLRRKLIAHKKKIFFDLLEVHSGVPTSGLQTGNCPVPGHSAHQYPNPELLP